MDGSHLPPDRYFSPGLYEDDLFMRRCGGVVAHGGVG